MDLSYHYPPELFSLLVDAIPKLLRSKKGLLTFFRGCGVSQSTLVDFSDSVSLKTISKYDIARTVLERLNAASEHTLRERREILRRIVHWDDFGTCWPNDMYTAKGLVSDIRNLINIKDSFTRINQEREIERNFHLGEKQKNLALLQERNNQKEQLKKSFYALFGESNPHKRGKALEQVMNDLFRFFGISLREAFTLKGDSNEGIIEQIDGVIELDGELYLVEMKWWNTNLGPGDISQHMVRVYGRGCARGIFIANPGYTDAAKLSCKQNMLPKSVFILTELSEFVSLLEGNHDLIQFFKQKIGAAIIDQNPFFRPLDRAHSAISN